VSGPGIALLIAFVGSVGGTVVYTSWRDRRSVGRLDAGECVRCGAAGRELRDVTSIDLNPQVLLLMCAPCEARTRRNQRGVAWFIAVAIVGTIASTVAFGW
jgi:hypothetical protein